MGLDDLFKPVKLGNVELKHRVVLPPLTRFRADKDNVPSQYAAEYYGQRSSEPGTLLITEATFISPRAGGYKNVPGIWSSAQIEKWKDITAAAHAKGCPIFLQLWALGRVAVPAVLEANGFKVSAPSAIAADPSKGPVPHALSEQEIQQYVSDYATAAKNAIEAGFDGVEIHGANGYLIDQFWQDVSNQRSDKYGGSIENRARFGLEVTKAVIAAVGGDANKVGVRLSPWGQFQGMKMDDPVPQFSYVVQELKKFGLAYLHLVESRISGSSVDGVYHDFNDENTPFIDIWGSQSPVILAGGFTPEKARRVVSELYTGDNILVAFGRSFISTPDLVFRLRRGVEFNKWDRATFYKAESPEGYIDYPFSKEFLAQQGGKL